MNAGTPPTGGGPSISLLSTAYRTEPYVARMIDSVRAQTRQDWELVVVDNGMSDEIARIVDGYSHDPRVRLVRQENRGMQGGVNAAAAVARGSSVAVLNSDDQVMPRFCERLVGVLDARPDVAAVAPDAWLLAEPSGVRLPRSYLRAARAGRPDERHVVTLADLVVGVCPYYTAAIRREVWDEIGGYVADEPVVADLDLWLRLVTAGHDLVVVPEPLGLYSEFPESLSRGAKAVEQLELARERLVVRYVELSRRTEDHTALARELRRSRHRRATAQSRIALFDGDLGAAWRHAADALAQERTARGVGILLGITFSPGLLTRLYPVLRRRRGPRPVESAEGAAR